MEPKNDKQYKSILLALIDPPTQADRESIDPTRIRELADSIRTQGLLQALVVRPVNGRYEIIAGHRRYLAASTIGLTHVTCNMKDLSDEDAALAKAMENMQREDLTPIEEAKAYKRLSDNFKMTYQQIADKSGKTAVIIKRRIHLLTLHPDVIAAIHEKKIPVGVGEEIAYIDDPNTLKYYLDLAIENGVTREVIRLWVKEYTDNKRRSALASVPFESISNPMMERPTYLPCDCCMGPSEISKLKLIRACPECLRNIDQAIKQAALTT